MVRVEEEELRLTKVVGTDHQASSIFPGNTLVLSRYAWSSFFAKNLFEQFHRTSNIWFLIVSIFQLIPLELNPTDSWNTIAPLSILLLLTLSKDLYNDNQLKKNDEIINNTEYLCWDGNNFIVKKCKDILVGDIIKVLGNQVVPADMLLFDCSNEQKIAFMDMSKLTGAATLKQVKAIDKYNRIVLRSESGILINPRLNCTVKMAEPILDYTSFYGRFKQQGDPGSLELKLENLLFKGSILEGVDNAVGLALYCGCESKIQLNSKSISNKTSRLERKVNTWVLYILCVLWILVFFSVIGFYVFNSYTTSQYNLLQPIVTFTLLYNNIIPISLFMVIDIIRVIQSYMMTKRMDGVKFNTERVNENLGQVEYILTDKTGTVTEQTLRVKALIIGHQVYFTQSEKVIQTDDARQEAEQIINKLSESEEANFDYLGKVIEHELDLQDSKEFMRCTTLCHTLTQYNEAFLGSHDEIALVKLSDSLGFKLLKCSPDLYVMEHQTEQIFYDVIATWAFNPDSKKSRILLHNQLDNYGILYVKGSCNVMLPLLNMFKEEKIEVQSRCSEMNNKGLRTMVLACKKIPLDEIVEIRSKIKKAEQSLLNFEGKIESMFKEIEKKVMYLGITCIEEEVAQETVETISRLKQSKIKLWLLSGDSSSNTDLAARNCGIIKNLTETLLLKNISDEFSLAKTLQKNINLKIFGMRKTTQLPEIPQHSELEVSELGGENLELLQSFVPQASTPNLVFKKFSDIGDNDADVDLPFNPSTLNYSVCVDRPTFLTAMRNESCRKLLVFLLVCADSVCFSMMTPKDKGDVVNLLKNNVKFKPLVVAVGDGEGDISMLQAADVGISVGSQGRSIVKNFSDLSIENFAVLGELILEQGHWNYLRLSRSILLFLYKNAFLTMMLLAYTFKCAYSGTSIFNASLLVGYNIFFTTLPLLVIGVFDEDISVENIRNHPEVYAEGIQGKCFTWKKLVIYLTLGVLQGILLILIVFLSIPNVMNSDGKAEDLEMLGTIMYVALIIAVLVQIYLDTYCYNLWYYLSHAFSIVFLMLFIIVQNEIKISDSSLIGIGVEISSSPFCIFSMLCTSLVCVIPSYALYTYRELFYPSIMDKVKANSSKFLIYNRLHQYKDSLLSLYSYSSIWKNNSKDHKFSMNKYTLRYNLPYIEKEYKDIFISENLLVIKYTAFAIWVLVIIWTIFAAVLLSASFSYNLARIVVTAGYGVLVFILFTDHFKRYFSSYTILIAVSAILIKFALEVSFNSASVLATALVPSITFILINVDWLYMTLINCLNIILVIITLSLEFNDNSKESAFIIIKYLILIIAITTTSAIVGFNLELYKRTEYQLLNIANAGVEKTQNILSLMLPPFVKNRVRDGVRYIAENQGEVTVLFCDICDFEGICKDYRPRDLRAFLDSLFKIFDTLCEQTGVAKIETVGKTYMACAGLIDYDLELDQNIMSVPHPRRALELAISMIQEVSTIRLANGNWLHVKIGIHSGTVAAGVVGYHKPQFSLVGDTVNTASRMCSTLLEYNAIQITTIVYEHLKNYTDVAFEKNSVEAKGKGNMETYIVREVRDNNSSDLAGGPISINSNMPALKALQANVSMSKDSHFESYRTLLQEKLVRTNTVLITTSWFSFKCKETEREKDFRWNRLKTEYNLILTSLIIALVIYCIGLLLSILEYYLLENYSNLAIIIGRSVVILYLIIIVYLHHRVYKHLFYPLLIFGVLVLMLIIALFNLIYSTSVPPDFTAIEIMYIIVILNHSSVASLLLVISANIFLFIPWITLASYSSELSINITNLLLVAVFSAINFSSIFVQEKKHKSNYNLSILAKKEIKETEQLLVQMMPPHVLEGLQNDRSETDRLENVTILFADIAGFTNWSSDKTPEEVVQMLSQLFSRFDKESVKFEVYKVHTIGDCYVVLGFTGVKMRDPVTECLNVVNMAYSMIDVIQEENDIQGSQLGMRIGIHIGEVIAGVIGTNIVRYDIWGPDVLIANKMESGGRVGWINVSQPTKSLLETHCPGVFKYDLNSELEIKALDSKVNCFLMTRLEKN